MVTDARPVALCVRCGRRPRARLGTSDLFICAACYADPETETETRDGLRITPAGRARRYMVDRHGWAGGWNR